MKEETDRSTVVQNDGVSKWRCRNVPGVWLQAVRYWQRGQLRRFAYQKTFEIRPALPQSTPLQCIEKDRTWRVHLREPETALLALTRSSVGRSRSFTAAGISRLSYFSFSSRFSRSHRWHAVGLIVYSHILA